MKKAAIIFITLFISLIVFSQDIDYAEYFIDSDPGYGMATPIAVSAAGTDVSLDFSADIAMLSQGIHYLGIRARDDMGQWSQGANQIFYLVKVVDVSESNIDRAEFFIDTDPGFGNATSIPVPEPGSELTLQFSPELQGLDPGMHYIHIRARENPGSWGSGFSSIFLIVNLPGTGDSDIQQVEYFIDSDPGYGAGTPVTLLSAGSDLTLDFTVALSGLEDGGHVLYIRSANGLNQWGQVYAEGFAYSATGSEQVEISSLFKIYPNPSSGFIQIEITDQSQGEFRVKLLDLNGRMVYEAACHNRLCELDLDLPGGMYLLNIESSERSITQKIILE